MREKVSKHFYRDEFRCKCGKCDFDVVDVELVKVLEEAREYFGVPLHINSACRCEEWNEEVGGKPTSQHKLGKAADVVMREVTPMRLYQFFDSKYPGVLGLGQYDTFVHVDVRARKARWGS